MRCQNGTLRVQGNNATSFVARNLKVGETFCTLSVFFAGLLQLHFYLPSKFPVKIFMEKTFTVKFFRY